jgi:hypothetical protein
MKNSIFTSVIALLILFSLQACKDSFLELKPRGTDLEDNYYRNRQEAYNGLVAIYDVVGYQSNSYTTKILATSAASDDHYAGGGGSSDLPNLQAWSNYTIDPAVGPQEDLWRRNYMGINRANILLSKLPDISMDENEKARFEAEARFLRAYFYFDLIRYFRNIPLIDHPLAGDELYEVAQVSPAEIYAFIESDLTAAMTSLPLQVSAATEAGRASEGTAKALLGKVYLQQEKFDLAAQQLAAVNGEPGQTSQYGYRLLDNFSDLFKVDNKFNSESILEISFTNTSVGDWGCIDCTEGNVLNILSAPRSYSVGVGGPDYVSGYGFLPVTTDLADLMKDDPRYPYTIIDMQKLADEGKGSYAPGYMDTGYFLEKFAGRESNRWTGAGSFELNFPQNMYDIRLADTYLLEAEAIVRGGGNTGRAAALLNAVRERVNLAPIAATLDNIKKERRIELAGEGHRWFDLIRWGDAAAALSDRGFVAGKNEVLPIPLLELDNTKLEQNKEYGGTK